MTWSWTTRRPQARSASRWWKVRLYFIAVDGFGPAVGDVKLTWTTNDDFAAAQVLGDPPAGGFSTVAVHNEGAKPEIGEPRHAGKVEHQLRLVRLDPEDQRDRGAPNHAGQLRPRPGRLHRYAVERVDRDRV